MSKEISIELDAEQASKVVKAFYTAQICHLKAEAFIEEILDSNKGFQFYHEDDDIEEDEPYTRYHPGTPEYHAFRAGLDTAKDIYSGFPEVEGVPLVDISSITHPADDEDNA